MKNRWARIATMTFLTVGIALMIPACDVAKAGTRCRPNGKWGRDNSYVLQCRSGRWARTITIRQYLQILASQQHAPSPSPVLPTTLPPPATAPPTAPPPTTTTTAPPVSRLNHVTVWRAEFGYPDTNPDIADWVAHSNAIYDNTGNGGCNMADDVEAAFTDSIARLNPETLRVEITVTWSEDRNGLGNFGCSVNDTLTVGLLDATAIEQAQWPLPIVSHTSSEL